MPEAPGGPSASLSATYESPSGHKDFVYAVTTPHVQNRDLIEAHAKSKYLSELRASTKRLQDDVNKFLTEKMEEDKKTADQDRLNGTSKQKSKDELEEENYGEENAEEE